MCGDYDEGNRDEVKIFCQGLFLAQKKSREEKIERDQSIKVLTVP